jgi:hypothetical protein
MITIGALNLEYGDKVVFPNIGKVNVDVFAPGVKFMLQRQITLTNFARNFNGRAKRCWSCCSNSFVLPNINGITSKTHFDGFRCSD